MAENPFSEPGESDRTVVRPMPGGRRSGAGPVPERGVAAGGGGAEGPEIGSIEAGEGPLMQAAMPLLLLLARLRNAASAPDQGDMRESTRRELRQFERRAREAGVPADQMRLAHYALCAALDDAVLNTPWGSKGRWFEEPLAVSLHRDAAAGAGFFDQLRALRRTLPESRPVMALMHVCLALGMMGPYRTAPDGPAQLERVRHQVYGLLERPPPGRLAPDSVPAPLPAPARARVPVWVVASAGLALVAGLYVWSLNEVNAASDAFYEAAIGAPPAAMPALARPPATPPPPPPPTPAGPGPAERLRVTLADVPGLQVLAAPASLTLRLPAALLFAGGGATISGEATLERIAAELPGGDTPIRILAYSDNQPIRSVAFPSRFALTAARAEAVRAALGRRPGLAERLVAEGRAEAEPIAPNTTPEGRERNRRIEIVLQAAP